MVVSLFYCLVRALISLLSYMLNRYMRTSALSEMINILVQCVLLYGKDFSYETPSLKLFDRAVGIANWLIF